MSFGRKREVRRFSNASNRVNHDPPGAAQDSVAPPRNMVQNRPTVGIAAPTSRLLGKTRMSIWGAAVAAIIVVVIAIAVLWVLFWWLYRRATTESAFVRTGMGGQKVVMKGGALVIPVLHEIVEVSMNTSRLEVSRKEADSLIARDRMRVDVTAEFYVRVQATPEAVGVAARTLGSRTTRPESLKELLEGKFVDALRTTAAEMSLEELHEHRGDFIRKVKAAVAEDLLKNGLELESASLTALDQTKRDFFNPNNAFDAEGLTKLTNEIEDRRRKRNAIEQDSEVAIQTKNLEAERRKLEIGREEEYARLEQAREIAIRRAAQAAEIAAEEAGKKRQSQDAAIAAQREIDLARLAAEQAVEQRRVQKAREVEDAEIERQKVIEAARVRQQQELELAEQKRDIAVAEHSQAQSEALSAAAKAKAASVEAEEAVFTARDVLRAERTKRIELIEARKAAEKAALTAVVAAESDRQEAAERAEADKIRTVSETGRTRAVAEAEADAEMTRARAAEIRYAIEAAAQQAMHDADKTLSRELIDMKVKLAVIEKLQDIIRESVRPLERIEGIKIVQVDGLGGRAAGDAASASPGTANVADQVVSSALRYRTQAPIIDALLKEVGLSASEAAGIGGALAKQFGPEKGEK